MIFAKERGGTLRTKYVFTIPEKFAMLEKGIVAALIDAIPNNWVLQTGHLSAPNDLLISGTALAYTEFVFGLERAERRSAASKTGHETLLASSRKRKCRPRCGLEILHGTPNAKSFHQRKG
jgi:hypothetical protein